MPDSTLTFSIPDDILTWPQEEHIQLAIATIRASGIKPNSDPHYSACQAERDFGVPRSLLGCRLKGMWYLYTIPGISEYILGGKSHQEVHVGEQLLTEAQEEILVKWVKIQGHCSVPMTYSSVDTECNHTLLKMRILAFLPINPCSST